MLVPESYTCLWLFWGIDRQDDGVPLLSGAAAALWRALSGRAHGGRGSVCSFGPGRPHKRDHHRRLRRVALRRETRLQEFLQPEQIRWIFPVQWPAERPGSVPSHAPSTPSHKFPVDVSPNSTCTILHHSYCLLAPFLSCKSDACM